VKYAEMVGNDEVLLEENKETSFVLLEFDELGSTEDIVLLSVNFVSNQE
jgi:hypothetical protein